MSPFKSRAQAKWAFANKKKWAAAWEDMTPNIKSLPLHVKKKKKPAKPKSKRKTTSKTKKR